MIPGRILTIIFVLSQAAWAAYGQSSVLNTGTWYKFSVEQHGVFKITYDQLKKIGVKPGDLNPKNIKIFGLEGGMLPQANVSSVPSALVELAITVTGEDDGVFHKQDQILFYAQGPDKIYFNTEEEIFNYESNLYSDKSYYFLTISDSPGKRMAIADAGEGGAPVNTFDDYAYHELDAVNILHSGREWYGEYFFLTTDYTFDIEVGDIVPDSPIRFISDVVSQSFSTTSMQIYLNGNLAGEQILPTIINSTYAPKGVHKQDLFLLNSNSVQASERNTQEITYSFQRASSGSSKAYLDFFLLCFKRQLRLYDTPTLFRSAISIGNTTSRYTITQATSNIGVWNITNPYEPIKQQLNQEGNTVAFTSNNNGALYEFVVFGSNIPGATFEGKVKNQNLHGLNTPHMVIVTHPDFMSEALRLANHRIGNGVPTAVVTPQEIYNEFSSGRQDVTAIRNFARHLHERNPSMLKAFLFFGKCSYDYKNRIEGNTNFVPSYESRNSLSPLETYSSDDYYGFLEDDEGTWTEGSMAQNHSLDIGVGRLPVKSEAEAKTMVNKIIAYEENIKMSGRWRKDIVFVADDGSDSDGFTTIHQSQANAMAENIETSHPEFNTRKIFLGTYPKTVTPTGEEIPEASEDLMEEFDNAVIINYTGHGSEAVLADEDIVTPKWIAALRNKVYPFLVTATCEFGRQDDPRLVSGAEETLLKADGGAIGLVTTARPVNSSTNFFLNLAFYEALFEKESDFYLPLGEIFKRTKNNSTSGVSNRNFSLLGDPMMRLALPPLHVSIGEIQTADGSDILKALSRVVVEGQVEDATGGMINTFNGTLEATLFDKRTEFQTIGKNDPSFQFEAWFNPLFRGKAKVTDGKFQFEFILPKNIAYEVGAGKLSLYAVDPESNQDATGATSTFQIGGSEVNTPTDNNAPRLEAYMGDTTFIDGGLVSPNSLLVVRLEDENGINISNYGIGNIMTAMLDDDASVYLLNAYYVADENDFTKGWVHLPLYNLPPGKHTITVKAWDTHNNPGQATVNFKVGEGTDLQIASFGNFPNPFQDQTTLFFTHNRPGEDLEARVILLDMTGKQLKNLEFSIPSSAYQVNVSVSETVTTFGKKLPPGIYFARLAVRSLSDGSKSERVTKLIVVN
ncbi:MAG TPA: type IX secretion system sortase PorU [Ohtaekwangia sp.]|nr:type IX secretion system sortase PorU [Ohtaekwangia sp.]